MNIKQLLYNYCCLSSNHNSSFFKHNSENIYFRSIKPSNLDTIKQNKYKSLQDVLGRPVTKAIIDRDNNLILDVGELVTYQAIQQARKANVLPQLLEAVYYCKPE